MPMMDGTPPSPIGSSAWCGTASYEKGDEFDQRATRFLASINWSLLTSRCSEFHDHVPCQLKEGFSIGHSNMARHLVFEDGVNWVARLAMPPLSSDIEGYIPKTSQIFQAEVASLRFFKAKTSIPVPTLHYYSLDEAKEIGAPYMLMDYIKGSTAANLRKSSNCADDMYGTPDQDQRFRLQMAAIQVELSTHRFNQIGTLYQNESTSAFYIGPDLETGKGPWRSSTDYYNDHVDCALSECLRRVGRSAGDTPSMMVPLIFKHLITLYDEAGQREGPFALTNRDFGAHNLLVNSEFEIVAVIDFDGIMSAPIEMVAQFPVLTGLDMEMPGVIATKPGVIERMKRVQPNLEAYKRMVQLAEAKMVERRDHDNFGHIMLSDLASVWYGMQLYWCFQAFVNDDSMTGYAHLLRKHHKDSTDRTQHLGP